MEITSDTILYGARGVAVGTGVGWILKKTVTIIFKLLMVLATLFVGALVYLQSIKVIEINERALDNLMTEGYNQLNQTVGTDAIHNPMMYGVSNLGLPVTSGLGLGLIIGWMKG